MQSVVLGLVISLFPLLVEEMVIPGGVSGRYGKCDWSDAG